ncbi:Hypothetical protein NTJ_13424 [Nesidiocoris tenuis]|uniref:Uncharacterized protein n=1 Tax=Nesidiocoris tenuis TaxID=355587 RepID=A0ABN7BAD8_9HEMI|nr:Hypothetical protein NTJ_13424 [Nesidiocoris tenuis]
MLSLVPALVGIWTNHRRDSGLEARPVETGAFCVRELPQHPWESKFVGALTYVRKQPFVRACSAGGNGHGECCSQTFEKVCERLRMDVLGCSLGGNGPLGNIPVDHVLSPCQSVALDDSEDGDLKRSLLVP